MPHIPADDTFAIGKKTSSAAPGRSHRHGGDASSKGWRDLIMSTIMCGILGYVIATFIGVGLPNILS